MTNFEVWGPGKAGKLRLYPESPGQGGLSSEGQPGFSSEGQVTAEDRDMVRGDDGWWRLEVPAAGPGVDYAFVLPDSDTGRPDPRSKWQPQGVHGPSRVYDPDS